jgi:hypothetical protein
MHQIAVQFESRYLVVHSLSRAWRCFLDGLAHLREQGLHVLRELGDVAVYGIEDVGVRFQLL